MGRIEDALLRAGMADPLGVGFDDARAPLNSGAATVDTYPRESEVRRRISKAAPSVPDKSTKASLAARPRLMTHFAEAVRGKLVVDNNVPAATEQYRRLAVTLHQIQLERPFKIVLISSAAPREGKTLTSVNLALTLSESYKAKVLLIDADLRRPSIHDVFRIPNESGLGDGLRGAGVQLPLIELSSHLTVLTAGRPDSDPTAGLTSDRMRAILAEASERFDWVILDSPPVGVISDARLLAALTDGVVFVVGAGTTSYRHVQQAIEEIGRDRIVGAVLNRVQEDTVANATYYSYYGGERDPS